MEAYLKNVAVIGAGLGGCAVALALSQRKVPVTLYESRPESSKSLRSGVLLTPNGLHVLDRLGVLARIKDRCFIPTHRVFRNDADEVTSKTPLVDTENTGYTNHRIWRSVLLDEMRLMLKEYDSVQFQYDSKFTGIISDTKDGVTFKINDEVRSASMLIGSDGLYSTVRSHLDPDVEPWYTGTLGVMGHLNYGEINWPPTASYVGNCTIQSKPGAILWMAEDNIGECAMYAMQVSYPKQSKEDLKALAADPDRILAFFTEKYDEWGPSAKSIIDALREHKETLFIWPYTKMPPLKHWFSPTTGRTVIIGDGAHALPPSSAQGVNGALEDSYSLALLLDSLRARSAESKEFLEVLSKWQKWRQDKVDAIYEYTTNTVDVGRMSEAERQKRIAEGKVKSVAKDGMAWLHKPDIEGNVKKWMEIVP